MGFLSKTLSYAAKPLKSAFMCRPKLKVKIDGKYIPVADAKNMIDFSKVRVKYNVKPDISMPVSPSTINGSRPVMRIRKNNLTGKLDEVVDDELGNVSIRLSKGYEDALPVAQKEIEGIFAGQDISVRAKGANSVYSKLKKKVIDKGIVIRSDSSASKLIKDAIGGRVTMKNLTQNDIVDTLKTIKINNKALTAEEQNIIMKFFKQEPLTKAEMQIAQKYSRPVKLALAEKQSAPVFNQVMLSSLKHGIESGATTIAQIEKSGVNADIIKALKTNYDKIKPMKITELENYTGHQGIPYFTDRQIAQFREMQLVTGNKFDIVTCSEAKRFSKSLTPLEEQAMKESGYTTAQFNVELSNGSLAEIQVRGKGPFGEVEHIAYDSRRNKNTLGPVYDEYQAAAKGLSAEEYKEYNKYLSACYDYYRDLELGIYGIKPKLPTKFNPILSEDNMIRLHAIDDAEQAAKKVGFVPHINIAA